MLRTLGPIPRQLASYDFPRYKRPFTSNRIRNTASHSGPNCRTTSQSTSMTSPRSTRAALHMASDKGAWTTTNEGREEDRKQTQAKREPACGPWHFGWNRVPCDLSQRSNVFTLRGAGG